MVLFQIYSNCLSPKNNDFKIRDLKEEYFLCKRANIELNFDPMTKYLISKHDIMKYPLESTKHYFDDQQKTSSIACQKRLKQRKKISIFITMWAMENVLSPIYHKSV